ncbi:protein tweety homolog 2-like [Choloepus didactylus]|uniref:protein tweety homolog 2-like n=1 Tax=Choloepus didactylus TaxID=27675 RepID=UPI00189E9339|nr:protein tweety homolog 2-like [Choloepus didactylus]
MGQSESSPLLTPLKTLLKQRGWRRSAQPCRPRAWSTGGSPTSCLVTCLGLAKHSKCLLALMLCCGVLALILSWASLAADTAAAVGTSDFCVAPDTFILNITQGQVRTEVTRYYLYCSQSASSPFQQVLTVFQRSLTTMQIQIGGLLQFAVPHFPSAEGDLLEIQLLLNSSEAGLHQLTAMLDCRGLHKDYLDALTGVCYDGIEGLLYLGLFSLLAALAFSIMICTGPRAWRHFATRDRDYDDIDDDDPFNPQARCIAAYNPPRGQLHSFCSYSSGLGSQTSLQPPAQTISNAPVSEYMNQAVLFGGNPRYENVPLIGRGSPPPTYSPADPPPPPPLRAGALRTGSPRARVGSYRATCVCRLGSRERPAEGCRGAGVCAAARGAGAEPAIE